MRDDRERKLIEHLFNRLKRFRGLAARYEKPDDVYRHVIYLACIHNMTS